MKGVEIKGFQMALGYFLDHLKGHTIAPKDSAYCFFSLRNLFIFQENTIFFLARIHRLRSML